jgi:hypothetical protein
LLLILGTNFYFVISAHDSIIHSGRNEEDRRL